MRDSREKVNSVLSKMQSWPTDYVARVVTDQQNNSLSNLPT